MDIEHKGPWQDRLVAATGGNATQTGAIMLAVLGRAGTDVPRFVGRAKQTSDGYLLCDFVDRHGLYHFGAFVGGRSDLDTYAEVVAKNLPLSPAEYGELTRLIAAWVQS